MKKKKWDHLDIVVTIGIFATILGAGIFFFASGGAPYGLFSSQLVEGTIDPEGIAQAGMGRAIVEAGQVRYLAETSLGPHQENLGASLMATWRAQQAQSAFVPGLRNEAEESFQRLLGSIQESAGRAIVFAAQRMWRAGNTETAQLKFIEALGRIQEGMAFKQQAAMSLRQEALGWKVVAGSLAMDRFMGQAQERMGSAIRNAAVMAATVDTKAPLAQEGLGGAILVAARTAEPALGESVSTPMVLAGGPRTSEVPYQAGLILLAALFVGVWGIRSVAETGGGFVMYGTPRSVKDQYRKTG